MISINILNAGDMSIVTGTPGPAGHPETRITFSDGSSDTYEWSGEINYNTMVDAGLFDDSEWTWIKKPVTVDIGNTVTDIGDATFDRCDILTSITMPNSITSIGGFAFASCIGLTGSLTIPNNVTGIGEHAFDGCYGLTSIGLPNGVTSIGDYAFYWCSGLTSVTIGSGMTSIGEGAFDGCTNLTSITIPNSVTSIGDFAFSTCNGLTSVTFLGKTLEQVQAMDYYPWAIEDESIIHVA